MALLLGVALGATSLRQFEAYVAVQFDRLGGQEIRQLACAKARCDSMATGWAAAQPSASAMAAAVAFKIKPGGSGR